MKNKTDEANDAAWVAECKKAKTVRAIHIEDCRMFFDAGIAFAESQGEWVSVKSEMPSNESDGEFHDLTYIQPEFFSSPAKASVTENAMWLDGKWIDPDLDNLTVENVIAWKVHRIPHPYIEPAGSEDK